MQILSAAAIVLGAVIFSVRMGQARKLRVWQFFLWLGTRAGLGCAGFMEYYVQRHGDQAAFAYSIMSAALLAVVLLVLITWALGKKKAVRV